MILWYLKKNSMIDSVVNVIKATGEKEQFSEEKVRQSIRRIGIPDELQNQVVAHVREKLYDNIKTSEIYHHISEFLGKAHPHAKAKYSLKQAIMALGPTGYPFEDFVAEILKTQGYTTQTRVILRGKCISHEIDVVAQKNREKIMVEAKFHNLAGTKTNVHVSLYTKARFDDVKEVNNFTDTWLITNTKITIDAIVYAECNNIQVFAWSYPQTGNLQDLIEQSGLAPITTLTFLSQSQLQILLEHNIVLCKDLCTNPSILNLLGITDDKKAAILSQAAFVCNIK